MFNSPLATIKDTARNGYSVDRRYLIARVNYQNRISFFTGVEGDDVRQRDRWDEKPTSANEYTTVTEAKDEALNWASKFISKKDRLYIVVSEITLFEQISASDVVRQKVKVIPSKK